MRKDIGFISLIVLLGVAAGGAVWAGGGDEWVSLFDSKSLEGWRASENAGSFKVADGAILADGPRAHLFYAGPVRGADFRNFELKAEVMSRPGANSGIYFHTRFQEKGWPAQGFEVQVNNTHVGEGDYRERKKTGSLYGVRNTYKTLVRDNEWFALHIAVRGKQVQVRVNGTLLVDYMEPNPLIREGDSAGQVIDHGTFALQCHDPHSQVRFRNIRVKPLPDDLVTPVSAQPVPDAIDRELARMSRENYPVVDYHAHLKGDLSLEDALRESRRVGVQYGLAVNGGLGFPVTNDAGALAFLNSLEGQPVFAALQGEGREWVTLFSKETIAKFDYVFTDAMTFTDDHGKRMRLWINSEVEVKDEQAFIEMYVDRILSVLNHEPIDIFVNPTFLPDVIAAEYGRLWTPERMKRVIDAAVKNGVAIEINNRYRIPSAAFIRMARAAGVKFTCGTNNSDRHLGRMEYCLEMVKDCGLQWQDMWTPKPDGEKPVQRRR